MRAQMTPITWLIPEPCSLHKKPAICDKYPTPISLKRTIIDSGVLKTP